ncbi:MAG TPA: flagellar basal body P-ring formation chaperone FlgA [Bdellovibrionales bacterium]|nr:flagellar basal body P-ring formation chaperone FlgA [Bdellovibrionales bacterium]
MTTFLFSLLLAAGAAHAALDDSAATASVVFVKAAVEIDPGKSDITLADLVVSRDLSKTAQEKFRDVRLADAPPVGETRTFTDLGLIELFAPPLAAIEAATGEKLQIKYPSRVTISKKRQNRFGREAVEKEILNHLRAQCADCVVTISALNVPPSANVPVDASWNIRVRSEIPKGSFSYPVEVNAPNGSQKTLWVSGQVVVQKYVSVATQAIAIGQKIQEQDIATELRDITYSNDASADISDLSSSVAARQLAAGQVIWKSSLRREVAIKQGDVVKVVAGSSDWEVIMDGVAQGSGYIGENVRVKIPRTQKIVSGILKEKGRVEVQ